VNYTGEYRNRRYFDFCLGPLREFLDPAPDRLEVTRQVFEAFIEPLKNLNSVALHLDSSEPTAYYAAAIDRIRKRENRPVHLVIFGAEKQMLEQLRRKYPRDVFRSADIMPAGILNDLELIRFAGLFDYQILSNSAFSFWAATLGTDKKKNGLIFIPKNNNCADPNWIQV